MSLRRSRRSLFSSRNSLFSFGGKKKKRSQGRTITSQRTNLGRRLEALEDRRMLSVSHEVDIPSVSTAASEDGTSAIPALTVSGDFTGESVADRTITLFATGGSATLGVDHTVATVVLKDIDYGVGTSVDLTDPSAVTSGGIGIINDSEIEGDESFSFLYIESSSLFDLTTGGGTTAIPDTTAVFASHKIVDDDFATISIVPGQTFGEDDGAKMVEIKLETTGGATLLGAVTFDVDITSGASVGDAVDGVDYDTYTTTPVTFSAGAGDGDIMTVPLTMISDRLVEGDETVEFTLSALSGTTTGVTLDLTPEDVTIVDDDTVTVSFSVASDSEGEPLSKSTVTVDVELDFFTTGTVGPIELADTLTVDIDITAATTATNVTDFTLSATSFTFDDTTTSDTLTITVIGDPLVEGDEIVDLDVLIDSSTPPALAAQASPGAIDNYKLTIVDDDESVLSVSSLPGTTVDETGIVTFEVSLTKPAAVDITVPVVLGGTASPGLGKDYTDPLVTDVVIGKGTLSSTVVVTLTDDAIVESDETLSLTISDPGVTDVTLGTATATTTITDDDISKVSITAGMASVLESAGTMTFAVVLSLESSTDTVVTFVDAGGVGDATSPADFGPLSSVTFKAGDQVGFLTVPIFDDGLLEGPEDAVIAIDSVTSTGALAVSKGAPGTATTTILDNDMITISVEGITIVEGTGGTTTAVVDVKLDGEIASPVTVDFETADGTATLADLDYTDTSGTATLPAGKNTTTTISIDITPDGDVEPDEYFEVGLLVPASDPLITVDTTPAKVTILNDDDAILSIVGDIVTETNGPGTTAMLTLENTGSTSAAFDVILNTLPGSAVAGDDYTPLPVTFTSTLPAVPLSGFLVHFPAGMTSVPFLVDITGDTTVEGPESFSVKVVGVFEDGSTSTVATGVSLTLDEAAVSIIDNDSATVSVAADADEKEDDGTDSKRTVTFTMTKLAEDAVVVSYTTIAGTADGTDYTHVSDTVTIPAGSLTATAVIDITPDGIVEDDEEFKVMITGVTPTSGIVTKGAVDEATLTIENDDSATVDVLDLATPVLEGTSGTYPGPYGSTKATVDVELTGDVQDEFKVFLEAVGLTGHATHLDDQDGTTGFVTFPAGSKSGAIETFDVFIFADDIVEPEEAFTVDITSIDTLGSAADITEDTVALTTGEVIIEDDDVATISLVAPVGPTPEDGVVVGASIVLTGNVQEAFTFELDTADGTATFLDGDYTPHAGTVAGFAPDAVDGDTAFVFVAATPDPKVESDETLDVTISAISPTAGPGTIGAVSILGISTTLTIENDDSTVATIAKTPGTGDGAEIAGPIQDDGEFTVTLSAPSDTLVTVTLDVPTGGATSGADYKTLTSALLFFPGAPLSQTIAVEVIDDTLDEGPETVVLDIASVLGTGASGSGSATVTILDNEVSVEDILVSGTVGSVWSVPAYSLFDATLHDAGDPDFTLPWVNLDTIEVEFSALPTGTLNDDTLTVTGLSGTYTASYAGITGTTAKWTLGSDIGADRLTITVNGEGVDSGSVALDGGDHVETFNVLPGDIEESAAVDFTDLSVFGTDFSTPPIGFSRSDLDGSGGIDFTDLSLFGTAFSSGATLPTPPPLALASADSARSSYAPLALPGVAGTAGSLGEDAIDSVFETERAWRPL